MIVQRPPYLMVPVTLNTTWFDSYGLQALQDVNALLVHGRRFIAPLILGITAFIALATSLSLSAIALSQEIHTATFTDQLSKNVPMALPTQEIIDSKLDSKVNALEEAVPMIGQEQTSFKVRLALRCHIDFHWICVMPLKVNESLYSWERVKNHILGIWNHSDLNFDLNSLHKDIRDISQAEAEFSASQISNTFFQNLSFYVSHKSFFTTMIKVALIGGLIILLLLLPVIVRLLRGSIQGLAMELHAIKLKNKKGEMLEVELSQPEWQSPGCGQIGDCKAAHRQ
ncbi:endogenous retrovirus group K member 13-1 Env polyprotein-like isoform X1 [Panthera pardus]|uniref:Endogenous retrovirus group K member 13-1 Env polyprotein-like isoform X1 n=1 Tax=Panthera pardus TaxID=9691 RepID=A0A9W2VFU3_PANPR|nr:endogenous retrovirus group K member 13-1 Env polyprotein-like isoform X1 [Panthera pardus]XP_053757482.1 endogenous retrovirus group K member 13-1 Env polyprotein-like isoform X1 [Panthera pardus]XP_053757483.1 endogenous retrovirus group K member 13-1 Env polyprotein-like isoform X1 [Panthera pardus]XP_053757484.1 endogenous retrovirus group K member 13-1 Env polyprotein-like isoform X1 [Panthera pardus]XP_053757485.1 endogenous retrovirus group K member 13-1 Env polyprotein-like isoform X